MGAVKHFARDNGMNVDDLHSVVKSDAFKKFVQEDLKALSIEHKLSGLEKPKDIFITDDAFSVENHCLTPTYKLKRNIAREYFASQIEEMYKKLDWVACWGLLSAQTNNTQTWEMKVRYKSKCN